eukprot:6601723-Prymnesium_polylepis.1
MPSQWGSIYQKDPALWAPCCGGPTFVDPEKRNKAQIKVADAYEASRTAEEKEAFGYALHKTMDLLGVWYAHQGTTAYMLTELPEGSERKVGYEESGWTTYERCSAEQIKKTKLHAAQWNLVLDLGAGGANVQAAGRRWPIGPDDFDNLIKTKKFTNGADEVAVTALYRKMSINQLGGINQLDFGGMPAPSVDEARCFARCLNLCINLHMEKICMNGLSMSDGVSAVLFSSLASSAMAQLKELFLADNKISDLGM